MQSYSVQYFVANFFKSVRCYWDSSKLLHVSWVIHLYWQVMFHFMFIVWTLFTSSPIDRHLDCFQLGALMNRATTKYSRTVFFMNMFYFIRRMPGSGTNGSYNFIRKLPTTSQSGCHIGKTLALVALYPSQNLVFILAILIGV